MKCKTSRNAARLVSYLHSLTRAVLLAMSVALAMHRPVHANPIITDMYGASGDLGLALVVALSALSLEYLLIQYLFRDSLTFWQTLLFFLIVNIITFPLTYILGIFWLWLAEILPVVIEPRLYDRLFRWRKIEARGVRKKVIFANLSTFVLGLVAYSLFAAQMGAGEELNRELSRILGLWRG